MSGPWSFDAAAAAGRDASSQQRASEAEMREASKLAADAERAYRVALAKRITELHAGGAAWTVCADLARGDEAVADLRHARDVAEGNREATVQAAWRLSADRRTVESLTAWSRGIALQTGDVPDDRLAWSGR